MVNKLDGEEVTCEYNYSIFSCRFFSNPEMLVSSGKLPGPTLPDPPPVPTRLLGKSLAVWNFLSWRGPYLKPPETCRTPQYYKLSVAYIMA